MTPEPVIVTARSYDEYAASWHEAHRTEDRSSTRADSYQRFAALLSPGGLVLDLGCGSGLDAPALAGRGLRPLGLDVSAGMLRIARAQPAYAGRLLLGEMRALPLAEHSVDGVWADGSLHHLPKVEAVRAVSEAARVLRPGGSFYASAERGDGEGFVERQEGVAGRRWYAFYEVEELSDLCAAAGFEAVDQIVGGPASHSGGFVALFLRKR